MDTLKKETLSELTGNILPFWLENMPDKSGGWKGRISGDGAADPLSPKGCILNSRILWTFSSAYRLLGREEYLEAARRTREYLLGHFVDPKYGGTFWSLNPDGTPLDAKKQFYAIAFAVYGLAEYARATGQHPGEAISLFRSIESHSRDLGKGGYIEACSRDWSPIRDMRLSERDRNDAKTMNTHLHILEAYTCLCRVWPTEEAKEALAGCINIFLGKIIRPDGHLGIFFDEDWNSTSDMVSYGHDIEASWLLCEAAEVLGDKALTEKVREMSAKIAFASLEGFGDGMMYEYTPSSGHIDSDRHWCVQAETVVGFLNQYRLTQKPVWLDFAREEWNFIKRHIIRPEGEWYWSAKSRPDGSFEPNTAEDLAGFWKCPYHNARMCLEINEMQI